MKDTHKDAIEDKCGRTILAGQFIAYGHALGRCAGLRIGLVMNTEMHKPEYGDANPRVTVWGYDDDWSTLKWNKPLSKPSFLYFPERMIVLDNVPEHIRDALEKAVAGYVPKTKRKN